MTNPLELLPHKPPMRLVEMITELVAGERAIGGRRAAASDFYFDGHFPGEPVVPAIILVEMLAQVGGLAAGSGGGEGPREKGEEANGEELKGEGQRAKGQGQRPGIDRPLRLRVAGLGPFKFPGAATPGAWLEARARVAGRLGPMVKIEGEVTSDGQVVAVGSVTLAEMRE